MRTGIIYLVTNIVNGKRYVGQTYQGFNKRKSDHVCAAFNTNNIAYNYYFHRAIRKYGIDAFVWEVIYENILIEDLNMYEKFYIALYSTFGEFGYNETTGGENGKIYSKSVREKMSKSNRGRHHSEETKKKISIIKSGHTQSAETRKKRSLSLKGRASPMKGRHHSAETREKMSLAQKGKSRGPMKEETKIKLSLANKGKHTKSKELKKYLSEKNSGEGNPFYGKHHSEETKKKLSLLNAKKLTPESVLEIRYKYSTKQYTQKQLAIEYGVSRQTIGDIVTHKIWKIINS